MATVIVLYVLIAAGLAAGVTWVVVTARVGAANARRTVDDEVYAAIEDAMAEVAARAAADRDAAVQHALQQAAVLNREQLGTAASGVQADLAAKKDVIGTRLDEVAAEVRSELQRLGALVSELGTASARSGSVRSTSRCGRMPRSPARSPTRRGRCARRWRTRRLAGSGASAWPRTSCASPGSPSTSTTASRPQVAGGTGRPDYTFDLPKGHVLYMDVKFPLASYLRYLEVRHRCRAPGPPEALPRRRPGAGARSSPSASTRVTAIARPSTTCCCSCPTSS